MVNVFLAGRRGMPYEIENWLRDHDFRTDGCWWTGTTPAGDPIRLFRFQSSIWYDPSRPETIRPLEPVLSQLRAVDVVGFLVVGMKNEAEIVAANDFWLWHAAATLELFAPNADQIPWVFAVDESYPVDSAALAYANEHDRDFSRIATRTDTSVHSFLERLHNAGIGVDGSL